ncbi:ABC transporter permease [Aquibium sp. LZ166]|uniref:ABC transporter permease n=1 Tax=Aquibium pacificus TaxID=3153579 RepID=A0ABV3SET9_9HYPH
MAAISLSAEHHPRRLPGRVLALQVGSFLAVWAAWEILSRSGLLYEGVVPSSFAVFGSIGEHLSDPVFYDHLGRTAYEVVLGFLIGGVAGFAVGVAFGIWPFAGLTGEPYLSYLAPTPKIIFLPIMMVLFGVGPGSKVAMAAISCFFPVAVAVYAGTKLVDPILLRVARIFKASRMQMVRYVYLPALVPFLITGARLGAGVAIAGTLIAEIKLSNKGLGFLAIQHYNFFNTDDMYAVLIIIFTMAIGINIMFNKIAARYKY